MSNWIEWLSLGILGAITNGQEEEMRMIMDSGLVSIKMLKNKDFWVIVSSETMEYFSWLMKIFAKTLMKYIFLIYFKMQCMKQKECILIKSMAVFSPLMLRIQVSTLSNYIKMDWEVKMILEWNKVLIDRQF